FINEYSNGTNLWKISRYIWQETDLFIWDVILFNWFDIMWICNNDGNAHRISYYTRIWCRSSYACCDDHYWSYLHRGRAGENPRIFMQCLGNLCRDRKSV